MTCRKSTFFLYSFGSNFYSDLESFAGFGVFLHICKGFVLKFSKKFAGNKYFYENLVKSYSSLSKK